MKSRIFNGILTMCLMLFLVACNGKIEEGEDIVKKAYDVKSFVTLGDQSKLLFEEKSGQTTIDLDPSGIKIALDPSKTYQEMDGFGAAMTESSAILINQLDDATRLSVLEDLFTNSGIQMSFIRLTIGASDFSLDNYTYNDTLNNIEDLSLSGFTIEREKAHLIPVVQQALQNNPNLLVMASPWSAPAWMKQNKNLNGGVLLDKYLGVYADYFVKYIKAMENEDIPIYAVTPQNEPLHESSTYPTMKMLPNQQIELIVEMGTRFESNEIDTLIMAYDHNWDRMDYPISVLNSKAAPYTAGVALHGYGGNVSETARIRNIFPDKGIWFTEISGGLWATNFADNMTWNMENIFMGSINLGAKGVLMWNIALDENNGPKNGGCQNCRGVLTIDSNTGEITKNEEYFMIGHFSKFVQKGAYRIDSSTNNANLIQTAFKNPDGSIIVVVHNKSRSTMSFSLDIDHSQMTYKLPGKGTTTFILNEKTNNEN